MSAFDFMKAVGLTNADSPDYGEMATAPKERRVISALCSCGYYHNPRLDSHKHENCPRCKKALLWQTYTQDAFDGAVYDLGRKVAQRTADDILANMACREVNPLDLKEIPLFVPVKWSKVKGSNQKKAKISVDQAEVDVNQKVLKVSSKEGVQYFKICL